MGREKVSLKALWGAGLGRIRDAEVARALGVPHHIVRLWRRTHHMPLPPTRIIRDVLAHAPHAMSTTVAENVGCATEAVSRILRAKGLKPPRRVTNNPARLVSFLDAGLGVKKQKDVAKTMGVAKQTVSAIVCKHKLWPRTGESEAEFKARVIDPLRALCVEHGGLSD